MKNKITPFDYINSITNNSSNQILNGELNIENYNAFIINRGLSYYIDTILYAQEMNIRPDIPSVNQYHFLHTLIKKKKRFSKWAKKQELDDVIERKVVDLLFKKYRYSNDKANDIIKLLTRDQMNELLKEDDRGQKNKKNEE